MSNGLEMAVDENGNPKMGPHGGVLSPDGSPLLGKWGQLIDKDGNSVLGNSVVVMSHNYDYEIGREFNNIGQIPYIIRVYSCLIMISTNQHPSIAAWAADKPPTFKLWDFWGPYGEYGFVDLEYCCFSNIY